MNPAPVQTRHDGLLIKARRLIGAPSDGEPIDPLAGIDVANAESVTSRCDWNVRGPLVEEFAFTIARVQVAL